MPKHKLKQDSSTSDSDSGPEDRAPVKKTKQPKAAEKSSDDEHGYHLGKNKYLKLSEFKGKWFVNIREYYYDGPELRPTRKGIMLTMEQWQKMKEHLDDINEDIKKNV